MNQIELKNHRILGFEFLISKQIYVPGSRVYGPPPLKATVIQKVVAPDSQIAWFSKGNDTIRETAGRPVWHCWWVSAAPRSSYAQH